MILHLLASCTAEAPPDYAGPGHPIVYEVAMSDGVACALVQDSGPFCWGANVEQFDPPPGTAFASMESAHSLFCGLTAESEAECWAHRDIAVPLPTGPTRGLGLGNAGSCWLDAEGYAQCHGWFHGGVLSVPDTVEFQAIGSADGAVCALEMDGQLRCWYQADYSIWGIDRWEFDGRGPPVSSSFIGLEVGPNVGAAFNADGTVETWGLWHTNSYPYAEMSLARSYGCGITTDGRLMCRPLLSPDDTWMVGDDSYRIYDITSAVPENYPYRWVSTSAGYEAAIAVDEYSNVYIFGHWEGESFEDAWRSRAESDTAPP